MKLRAHRPRPRERGAATALPDAAALGLPFIEITTDPDNGASQRVIEKAGSVLFEHCTQPAAYGNRPGLRFRIDLARGAA